jgi:hypothetical protein
VGSMSAVRVSSSRCLLTSAPRCTFLARDGEGHARDSDVHIQHHYICGAMEPSPLTQDSRPQIFQPKIIRLYETLFKVRAHYNSATDGPLTDAQENDEDTELSDGFWQEFFLHRPDSAGLKRILDSIPPDEMLHLQSHSQQLVHGAIHRVKLGKPPADEIALEVRCRSDMTSSRAYGPDLDSLPRCRPGEEVHQPQLRCHFSPCRAARRRRRHDRLHSYPGHCDTQRPEQYGPRRRLSQARADQV